MYHTRKIMRTARYLLNLTLVVLAIVLQYGEVDARRVATIDIDDTRSSTYLPFEVRKIAGTDWETTKRPVLHPVKVPGVYKDSQQTAWIVMVANPAINQDQPAGVHFEDRASGDRFREAPFYYTACDFCVSGDWEQGDLVAIVGCYRHDSAFVLKTGLSDTTAIRYLASGTDGTGDGEWRPGIPFIAQNDYDFDGREEAFFQVFSARDPGPRVLYCIEIETLDIEWSLPVASSVRPGNLFVCGDTAEPAVIFISYGPQNKVSDVNFNDEYGYVTVVDDQGVILHNQEISSSLATPVLGTAQDGGFYLSHSLPLDSGELRDRHDTSGHWLSLITANLTSVRTVPLESDLQDVLWLFDYDKDGYLDLHALSRAGDVLVFDSNLSVLARGYAPSLQCHLGRIPLEGYDDPGHVFHTWNGTEVYSAQFKKLAQYNEPATEYQPMVVDHAGNVRQFMLTNCNVYYHVAIQRRDVFDLARIAFWEYQTYVLSVLSAAVVALILVNHYRRKTRKNLVLIREQKNELEEVHRQLQDAQEAIIAQEKYTQAKDIAGGFAHEIRNALLPAEGALARLERAADSEARAPLTPEEYTRRAQQAVSRALKLTRLISTYTKLEASKQPEPVDLDEVIEEVLEADRTRISDQGVTIEKNLRKIRPIRANKQQLYLCFNNLLLNSLDALTGRPDPHILITVDAGSDAVRVTIQDNGVGIAHQDLSRVFDTFYSTKPSSGTGLGLTMVKKIVEMYDGTIAINSEPDYWTRVDLTFVAWPVNEQKR